MDPKKYICGLVLFFMATLCVDRADSANILVIAFFSSKSHKMTYLPLIEELGKRGHNITMVSPVKPMKEMANVKEVFTLDVETLFLGSKFNPFELKKKGQTVDVSAMSAMILEVCNQTYGLPQVRALLQEKFDLVFLQPLFNDCVLGLIYRLGSPFVLFTPTSITNFMVNKVGGNFPHSMTPGFTLGYSNDMNFYQRFMSFGVNVMVEAYLRYFFEPNLEKVYREKLGNDIPSINEIFANASLALSNGHFSLSGPKPYFPDVIDVGGIHSRPAKPIPKDLEDFISKGSEGFILFSMGSTTKGDMMPDAKRKLILNVFSKLKQQVLWKWESESMPDLPENVKLSKWLPQQDLLGHKDIRMFITHCGGGSTEESIYHGVPLVGIPMFADQPNNANLAEKFGILVRLNWNDMTEQDFEDAIHEVLNNSTYRDNVKKLSALYSDRPTDPLELGVYWVEYVLRHKGATHLRSVGRKLNTFQYHSYDVISTYLAIIGGLLYIIVKLVSLICGKIFCLSPKTHKAVTNGKKVN